VTRVKICCIASIEEARLATAHGAAALGLVSAMPSGPGVIADECIAEIAAAMRGAPIRSFLLTARTSAEAIAGQHARAGTTTLQLVDRVPHAELRRLRALCPGVELVQVIHVTAVASVDEAVAVAPLVDAVLALSRRIRDAIHPLPLWLAGGLRVHNVAQAIATVQPFGLDLCTGVRSEGRLDATRLVAFMHAVRAAA